MLEWASIKTGWEYMENVEERHAQELTSCRVPEDAQGEFARKATRQGLSSTILHVPRVKRDKGGQASARV